MAFLLFPLATLYAAVGLRRRAAFLTLTALPRSWAHRVWTKTVETFRPGRSTATDATPDGGRASRSPPKCRSDQPRVKVKSAVASPPSSTVTVAVWVPSFSCQASTS